MFELDKNIAPRIINQIYILQNGVFICWDFILKSYQSRQEFSMFQEQILIFHSIQHTDKIKYLISTNPCGLIIYIYLEACSFTMLSTARSVMCIITYIFILNVLSLFYRLTLWILCLKKNLKCVLMQKLRNSLVVYEECGLISLLNDLTNIT